MSDDRLNDIIEGLDVFGSESVTLLAGEKRAWLDVIVPHEPVPSEALAFALSTDCWGIARYPKGPVQFSATLTLPEAARLLREIGPQRMAVLDSTAPDGWRDDE